MRDENLRRALGYRKFTGPTRLLVLDTNYHVVRDVVEGAEDLGWATSSVTVKSRGNASSECLAAILKALVYHRPDFIVTINHLGFDVEGSLAGLLSRYEIPMSSWFVDHPLPILGGADSNATEHVQVFCFERTALAWLAAHGYQDPVHLPTASNRRYCHPDRVCPTTRDTLATEVSFVGSSWWNKARLEPPKWARKAAAKLCKEQKVDRRFLANGFETLLSKSGVQGERKQFTVARAALAEASMRRRRAFARAMARAGLRIFGDPHWSKMAPGVKWSPGVDPQKGLPALFAGSAVSANVTAEQMPTAVNQRVWDVPGTGGFLLTDAQEDGLELFKEDEEMAFYRTFEEAADKARYYVEHAGERRVMTERAFAKVEAEHRVTHRLKRIAEVMKRRFG